MFKHYLKFAIRNFKSNKVIFGGSLLTLCLGALCISLLFSYVYNELTMNSFLTHKDDIYVTVAKSRPDGRPGVLNISEIKSFSTEEYPEIKSLTTIIPLFDYIKLSYKNELFIETGFMVDSTFLTVFDYPLLRGNSATALNNPNSILLTEKLAKQMFGEENPMGKVINAMTVTGILKNPPANSMLQFDYIKNDFKVTDYGVTMVYGAKDIDLKRFSEKLNTLKKPKYLEKGEIQFIPLNEVYFNKGAFYDQDIFARYGDKKNLSTLAIIILVILVISILNFSNLQIISTNTNLKTRAIKQVNGANLKHLNKQKIVDVAILIGVAAVIITICYKLILPYFNELTQVFLDPPIWTIILLNVAILLVLALVGLVYPLLIKGRVPIHIGLKKQGTQANMLKGRKVIIVAQYALTFILLISSVVVVKQLQLMLSKDLGFETENIIHASMVNHETGDEWENTAKKYEYVTNTMNTNPNIAAFTEADSPLKNRFMEFKRTQGEDKLMNQNTVLVNYDYLNVFSTIEITEGRFFEKDRDSSGVYRVVINEAAKKYWNISDITQSTLSSPMMPAPGTIEIIGVVKDFNYEHLSAKPKPLVLLNINLYEEFLIKFEKGAAQSGLAFIEKLFKEQNPKSIFKYSFLKDDVNALYSKEKQLSIIYILFTLIALLISAIGLFTIALYDTQRRVKEIAVRKVNGAKVSEVLVMLNKSIVKWIVVAFLIASPIAYIIMQKWLENFAYKAGMSWWIFAAAGAFTLIIALMTVSWRSYKAAMANPVDSLRSE